MTLCLKALLCSNGSQETFAVTVDFFTCSAPTTYDSGLRPLTPKHYVTLYPAWIIFLVEWLVCLGPSSCWFSSQKSSLSFPLEHIMAQMLQNRPRPWYLHLYVLYLPIFYNRVLLILFLRVSNLMMVLGYNLYRNIDISKGCTNFLAPL